MLKRLAVIVQVRGVRRRRSRLWRVWVLWGVHHVDIISNLAIHCNDTAISKLHVGWSDVCN